MSKKTFGYVVLKNLAIGYCVVLVALGAYSRYLSFSYRDSVREAGNATANIYLNELKKEMKAVENRVLSWYVQDYMGWTMEVSRDHLRKFEVTYEFSQLFKEEITREENIRAAILFYDGYSRVRYSARNGFDDRKIKQLKKMIRSEFEGEEKADRWLLFSYDSEDYLVYVYGRRGVSIVEVLDYEMLTSDVLENYNANDVELIYVSRGEAISNESLAEKLGIPDEFKNSGGNPYRGGYYIFQQEVLEEELSFFLLLPYNQSLSQQTGTVFVIAIVVITLVSALLSYQMFRREMINPLNRMTETLRKIGEGNADEKMDENMKLKEYNEFGSTFNRMITQIRELKIQAYEEKIDRDKARLQALQLQIKPHFYLNSLTTLFSLSRQEQYDKMEDKILTISDYIRYSFKDSFVPVPLREELKFAEDTVTIRRDSYNRGIEVYKDIDEQLIGEQVLPLSIQTFVENSMKYAKPNGPLRVHIHVSKLSGEDGDYMDIVVSDNGLGYPPEWIEKINGTNMTDEEETHIGIFNLKKRLMLEYGDKVEFIIRNSGGAVSEIIYPMDRSTI